MRTRVKIGCTPSPGEVRAAVAAGADAVGLDLTLTPGAAPVSEAQIVDAAAACPPGVCPFLLTSHQNADAIADQARKAGVWTVQLVHHLDPTVHAQLRKLEPALKLVQVVHVEDEHALELARGYGRLADALLLDSGRPYLTVAELGGTGRTHDWALSRRIVSDCPAPVWLAGGLNASNVGEAIERVNPFGVDVRTGVRTANRLDARKLSTFFHDVRAAKGG